MFSSKENLFSKNEQFWKIVLSSKCFFWIRNHPAKQPPVFTVHQRFKISAGCMIVKLENNQLRSEGKKITESWKKNQFFTLLVFSIHPTQFVKYKTSKFGLIFQSM